MPADRQSIRPRAASAGSSRRRDAAHVVAHAAPCRFFRPLAAAKSTRSSERCATLEGPREPRLRSTAPSARRYGTDRSRGRRCRAGRRRRTKRANAGGGASRSATRPVQEKQTREYPRARGCLSVECRRFRGRLGAVVDGRRRGGAKCRDQTGLTAPVLPGWPRPMQRDGGMANQGRVRFGRLAPPVRPQPPPDRSRPGSSCASSEPSAVARRSRASPRSYPRAAQRRAGERGQGCPILSRTRPPCHPSTGRC